MFYFIYLHGARSTHSFIYCSLMQCWTLFVLPSPISWGISFVHVPYRPQTHKPAWSCQTRNSPKHHGNKPYSAHHYFKPSTSLSDQICPPQPQTAVSPVALRPLQATGRNTFFFSRCRATREERESCRRNGRPS